MKINGRLVIFTLLLIAMATLAKFYFGPQLDWSGFSPVIAIALFSGMIIRNKSASFLLPLLAVLASDLIIQFLYERNQFRYPGIYDGQLKNYLILFSATAVGMALKGRNYLSLLTGAIAAPTVFFLLSNFSVWLTQEVIYSRDFNGLMTSYINGLPFYRNALIATFVSLPVILFAYNYLAKQRLALKLA
jgi:hypothetical protein